MKKQNLMERKPSDRTIGKHTFKGVNYDKNGNPRYTCDTLSDEDKKACTYDMVSSSPFSLIHELRSIIPNTGVFVLVLRPWVLGVRMDLCFHFSFEQKKMLQKDKS